jgi:hypothetical protein
MTVRRVRGKWIVDLRLANGERVRRVASVQTKHGAIELERKLMSQQGSSISLGSSAPGKTLREFAVEWLQTYAVVNNKASEVVSKEYILRRHLLPFFDNRMLDRVTTRDVEKYKAEKPKGVGCKKPLTPASINNHLVVLRKMLVTAKEWGLVTDLPIIRRLRLPPAGSIGLPRKSRIGSWWRSTSTIRSGACSS